MIVVDQRQLQVVSALGTGGTSSVYHATGTDPRLPGDLAFKLPHRDLEPSTAQLVLTGMRTAVQLFDLMSSADLAELDELTTRPLAMVQRDGRDVGCVSRLIDHDYFVAAHPPGGRAHRRLFEFQLLSVSGEQAKALGINRSAADDGLVRLALMARLAYTMEILHRPRGNVRLVYGDLNPRRVVLATQPPRVLLTGCDAVADVADPSRRQSNTPYFVPPELLSRQQELQDQFTDVYKLGLCVIRGLSAGRGAAQVTDPASPLIPSGMLDRKGIDLLARAVGDERDRRPSAEQIKEYLIGRVLQLAEGSLVRTS